MPNVQDIFNKFFGTDPSKIKADGYQGNADPTGIQGQQLSPAKADPTGVQGQQMAPTKGDVPQVTDVNLSSPDKGYYGNSDPTGVQGQQLSGPKADPTGIQGQQGEIPNIEDLKKIGDADDGSWIDTFINNLQETATTVYQKFQDHGMAVTGTVAVGAVVGLGVWYFWKTYKQKNDLTPSKANITESFVIHSNMIIKAVSNMVMLKEDVFAQTASNVEATPNSVKRLVTKSIESLKEVEDDITTNYMKNKDAVTVLNVAKPIKKKLEEFNSNL